MDHDQMIEALGASRLDDIQVEVAIESSPSVSGRRRRGPEPSNLSPSDAVRFDNSFEI